MVCSFFICFFRKNGFLLLAVFFIAGGVYFKVVHLGISAAMAIVKTYGQ